MSHTDYKLLIRASANRNYYIAPNAGSGAGTLANPFGLADLQTAVSLGGGNFYYRPGSAFSVLQPGDTLYYRGGSYHLLSAAVGSGYYAYQLLSPLVSGTAGQPITLRAYPGETVMIIGDDGNQAIFGTGTPAIDYVRFLGFTVQAAEFQAAFDIAGTGHEVAYNEIIGTDTTSGDNHDGLRVDTSDSIWIHHNNIHGWTGTFAGEPAPNSAGLKTYNAHLCTVEDNYVHDCCTGIYDKIPGAPDGSNIWTVRRNWVTGNTVTGLAGPGYAPQAVLHIYDNVLDSFVAADGFTDDSQIYNNLITASGSDFNDQPNQLGINAGGSTYRMQVWNNIFLAGGLTFTVFRDADMLLTDGVISYMNHNVYTGTPVYHFGYPGIVDPSVTYTLAQFQALGFEANTTPGLSGPTDIYVDTTGWVLKTSPTNWTVAGVVSPSDSTPVCVGPGRSTPTVHPNGVITVAQVMDASRYGPGAIGDYV